MLALHDTASGRVVELSPRDPGVVSLYVCGPTVYGEPHVGHARTSLLYDIIRRYLVFRGLGVKHVSNITDIDDKIIDRANREKRSWSDVAAECEGQWWVAMDALSIERPTAVPHATDYIDGMVTLVSELIANNVAYETTDGVYLSVRDVPGYGLLKHQNLDELLAGARVEVLEEKRFGADFALWKKAKPSEPSWQAPFGDGRPGWHTECVVMALSLLGEGFDLHGGGLDLVFPHHENERAQAVALHKDFARLWVHGGLLTRAGVKMSKSLGNFMTVRELIEEIDPRAYRLLVLRSHYRSPLEVNETTLADAVEALKRVDAMARRIADAPGEIAATNDAEEQRFVAAMDDDLNTPIALAGLFDGIRRVNTLVDQGDAHGGVALGRSLLRLFDALGLKAGVVEEIDPRVADLLSRREAARTAKDFALADALRQEIESLGYVLEDTPAGGVGQTPVLT